MSIIFSIHDYSIGVIEIVIVWGHGGHTGVHCWAQLGQGEVCILYIILVSTAICLAVTFRGDYDKNTSHARSLGTRCYVATRQRASSVSGGRRYGRYGGFIVNDLLKLVVFLVLFSLLRVTCSQCDEVFYFTLQI